MAPHPGASGYWFREWSVPTRCKPDCTCHGKAER